MQTGGKCNKTKANNPSWHYKTLQLKGPTKNSSNGSVVIIIIIAACCLQAL